MKRISLILLVLCASVAAAFAVERSFSIRFGAPSASTTSLTNANFLTAVSAGADYIESVTSVVAVFPETDAIRISSQKTNGKFNIHLKEDAQVVATRIVLEASRYDNDRDAEASIMLNSETLEIPSVEPDLYTLHIPSRPEKILTNLIIDVDHRVYLSAITVYYDDANGSVDPVLETVATPVFTPAGGTVTAGSLVEIATSTPGATVYYTVDGTEPTSSAIEYTGPIELNHDITLRAFAVAEGMKPSEIASASFVVRNPEATLESFFNFAAPETLTPSVAAPEPKEYVDLDGRSFSDGDVVITFAATGTGNTHVRLYGSYDAGTDLRIYDGDMVTVRAINPAMAIASVSVTLSTSGTDADAWFTASDGEWIWERDCWEPTDDYPVNVLDLTSFMQSRISSMSVTLKAVSGVELRGLVTPAEEEVLYDLSGRRVGKPDAGFYIRLRGDKAEKIAVRK
ncbi:MAG: hypothetical protein HDS65_10035 [Bacteroidales bacterium]|nr:hypothetical protein [Bacteroidales bacterium]